MKKSNIKRENFKEIKLLVLDFDGVMTDNRVYMDEIGREMVCCSRADGLGIERLRKEGIKIFVISKERNKVVNTRCKKLKIKCILGVEDKLKALRGLLKRLNLSPPQTCYLGNDINDIGCLKFVKIGCAVADSHFSLLRVADYITKNKGGNGAVREICDLILSNKH